MTAVPRQEAAVAAMTLASLEAVLRIENAAYEFPWTRGNFIDSLAAGYDARLLRDTFGGVIGYYVAMQGVAEVHLLNLTVAPALQGRGHGQRLLHDLMQLARRHGAERLWLEVRESNERAQALYLRQGFQRVGLRRGYYPASGQRREDAIVMGRDLPAAEGGHGLD